MKKILSASILILIFGFSSKAIAQETEEIKEVVTQYLESFEENDFEKLARNVKPQYFEKVLSKTKMKAGFQNFLFNPQFSINFKSSEIRSIASVVEFENSKYSTVSTSQVVNLVWGDSMTEKEIADISAGLLGLFGRENARKLDNGYELNLLKTLILNKEKDSRWFLVEYDDKMQKQADIDAITPKGAQSLLGL